MPSLKHLSNFWITLEFVPEMHLRLPGFTYSACGKFTKNKERMRTFKKTADSRYIC